MGVSKIPGGPADKCAISQNLGLMGWPPTLRASTAKGRMKINEHLVILNISGVVLVKIVEKLRAQHSRTGCGRGLTLVYILRESTHRIQSTLNPL